MTATATGAFELRGEPEPLRDLLRDVWRSRRLVLMLARKDFFVRYRRASFGLLWAVGLPLVQAAVLAVVFSRVVRIETGTNFATFLYAGLVPFTFFRESLSAGVGSIVAGSDMASKVYFPRAVFPLVVVTTALIALPANLLVLFVVALGFGVTISPIEILWLVPAVAVLFLLSASFALVLAALQVYFRDVQYIVQAALLAWLYASPVIYPMDLAPDSLRLVLVINPISGVIEMFRAAIVGADSGWHSAVISTGGWIVGLLIAATLLHRRYNRVFTDLL